MHRGDLKDQQWQKLAPLLPAERGRVGRPAKSHRRVINGILWFLRTGAPWRDLPERYGKWETISSRFYRWQQSGLWARVLHELQRQADEDGRFDWDVHFVDGTVIRAHQHAAGAKGGTRKQKRSEGPKAASPRKFTSEPRAPENR